MIQCPFSTKIEYNSSKMKCNIYTYTNMAETSDESLLTVEQFIAIIDEDVDYVKNFKTGTSQRKRGETLDEIDTDSNEPLLQEEQRYCLFPIKYHDIFDEYKTQQKSLWIPEEISMDKDREDFEKLVKDTLPPDEIEMGKNIQTFVKNVLGFFATSDGVVLVNIMDNFSKEVKIMEAQCAYQVQGCIETIHSEVYSRLIDEIISDNDEKLKLYNAVNTMPCIESKTKWALIWANSKTPFAQRLVAFAVVEGIFFSGSFCAIYWLKQKNIMPGLTQSNEFIARDEALHCRLALLLYRRYIVNKLPQTLLHKIVMDAVTIEKEFIIETLQCKLIGMNSDLMSQYIEFVADILIESFGCEKIYHSTNPFSFMDNINLVLKSNFFETRVTTYKTPDLSGLHDDADDDF
jgi:ribonucleotide reductase beta subunit family protein with ferritin-like domain